MSSWISKFTTTFLSNWLLSSHRSGSRFGMSFPIWVSLRAAPLLRAATDLKRSCGESRPEAEDAQPARVWKEPLSMTIGEAAGVRQWAGSSKIGSGEVLESWKEKIWHTGGSLEAIFEMRHYKIRPGENFIMYTNGSYFVRSSFFYIGINISD